MSVTVAEKQKLLSELIIVQTVSTQIGVKFSKHKFDSRPLSNLDST